jgi:tetratricopeptide (TPR) repeat protein
VLAIIVGGEPGAEVGPGCDGCFPPALVEPEAGASEPCEPIAADVRRQGDGKRFGLLKLVAGLLGVGLNDLVQRDAARRQRRLAVIAAASLAGTAAMMLLAIYANLQRIEATRQRVIAETETADTRAALDYLVSLFEIANPATENPETISALTVLQRGRAKIDSELAQSPRVQGKLLSSIGQIYMNLGLYEAAEDALGEAITRAEALPADRLSARLELAFARSSRHQLDAATALLDEAEPVLGEPVGDSGIPLGEWRNLRARYLEIRGAVAYAGNDYDSTEQFWRSALEAYSLQAEENAEELGRVHTNLGLILTDRGRFDEAREQLEAAIEIHSREFGQNHVKTATSLNNLAFTLFSAGEYDDAAPFIERTLVIYRQILEPGHPHLASAWSLAGRIRHARGDLDGAADSLEASAEAFRRAFGDTHHQIGWTRVWLALVLADAGKFDAAFAALDEARAIYGINYPGDDIYAGDLLVHEAIVLAKSGQAEEARRRCDRGLALIRGKMSDGDSYVQRMMAACAHLSGG